MNLRTTALDCLYVNWAVPRTSAPELPKPLRFEVHHHAGQEFVFVSMLMFQLSDLRLESFPRLRLSYPQMNVRVYVFDGDDLPAVLFLKIVVPHWVVPVSRLLARQPATGGRFRFPAIGSEEVRDRWHWQLVSGGDLAVTAEVGSPMASPGPSFGSWTATVDHFRNRPRGYVLWEKDLRPIRASQASVEAFPLRVDLPETGLLQSSLAGIDGQLWQSPHSSWLCPRVSYDFSLGPAIRLPQAKRVAARPC